MLYPLFGSPRLPKIEKSQPHKIDLSGTVVRFAVPPFSAKWGENEPLPDSVNIFDSDAYLQNRDDIYSFIRCFDTTWSIKGLPLIQHELGWIGFSISVIRSNSGNNLYHPKLFQEELCEYLNFLYGNNGKATEHTTETLINWSTNTFNNQKWVSFFQKREKIGKPSFTLFWKTPISDAHILSVSFNYKNYNDSPLVHQKILSFSNSIVRSVHIDHSTTAEEQKEATETNHPGQQYSEHMEPLRWIRPKKEFISVEEFLADDDK